MAAARLLPSPSSPLAPREPRPGVGPGKDRGRRQVSAVRCQCACKPPTPLLDPQHHHTRRRLTVCWQAASSAFGSLLLPSPSSLARCPWDLFDNRVFALDLVCCDTPATPNASSGIAAPARGCAAAPCALCPTFPPRAAPPRTAGHHGAHVRTPHTHRGPTAAGRKAAAASPALPHPCAPRLDDALSVPPVAAPPRLVGARATWAVPWGSRPCWPTAARTCSASRPRLRSPACAHCAACACAPSAPARCSTP